MTLFEIIFLAIALGVDCLIVSFSLGLLIRFKRTKISTILALIMGFFQGGMPVITYLLTGLCKTSCLCNIYVPRREIYY